MRLSPFGSTASCVYERASKKGRKGAKRGEKGEWGFLILEIQIAAHLHQRKRTIEPSISTVRSLSKCPAASTFCTIPSALSDNTNGRASTSGATRRQPSNATRNRPAPYYQRRRSEPPRSTLRMVEIVNLPNSPAVGNRSAILLSPNNTPVAYAATPIQVQRIVASAARSGAGAPATPTPQRATFINPDTVLNNPFSTPRATSSGPQGPTRNFGHASNPGTSDRRALLTS
jgi:hypothetical protein